MQLSVLVFREQFKQSQGEIAAPGPDISLLALPLVEIAVDKFLFSPLDDDPRWGSSNDLPDDVLSKATFA